MNGTKKNKSPLIWGVILILFGFLFLLQNWLGTRIVWRFILEWWPLLLVAIGVSKIYRYFAPRSI